MGMFIPCNAIRERVLWRAKLRLAGRKSTPSFREYVLSLDILSNLEISRNIIVANI